MPAISTIHPRSCLQGLDLHHRADYYPTHLCIGFDRSDQKKPKFTHATVPSRGCRVKQTVECLFTMSKDPVTEPKGSNATKLALFLATYF
jgi:hypothetical protein